MYLSALQPLTDYQRSIIEVSLSLSDYEKYYLITNDISLEQYNKDPSIVNYDLDNPIAIYYKIRDHLLPKYVDKNSDLYKEIIRDSYVSGRSIILSYLKFVYNDDTPFHQYDQYYSGINTDGDLARFRLNLVTDYGFVEYVNLLQNDQAIELSYELRDKFITENIRIGNDDEKYARFIALGNNPTLMAFILLDFEFAYPYYKYYYTDEFVTEAVLLTMKMSLSNVRYRYNIPHFAYRNELEEWKNVFLQFILPIGITIVLAIYGPWLMGKLSNYLAAKFPTLASYLSSGANYIRSGVRSITDYVGVTEPVPLTTLEPVSGASSGGKQLYFASDYAETGNLVTLDELGKEVILTDVQLSSLDLPTPDLFDSIQTGMKEFGTAAATYKVGEYYYEQYFGEDKTYDSHQNEINQQKVAPLNSSNLSSISSLNNDTLYTYIILGTVGLLLMR